MTSVFGDVDDFCQVFEPEWHKRLICNTKKPLVISKLSLSEIMTIIICFHQSASRDFKHYCQNLIVRHKSDYFPNLVSYNRFVELMKQALIPLTVYLKLSAWDYKLACDSLTQHPLSFVITTGSTAIRFSQKRLNVARRLQAGNLTSGFI